MTIIQKTIRTEGDSVKHDEVCNKARRELNTKFSQSNSFEQNGVTVYVDVLLYEE